MTTFSKGLRWTGESVDIAIEILTMAKEIGFCEEDQMERVVRLALVSGLPEKVFAELQHVKDADDAPVAELFDRAGVLVAKEHDVEAVSAVAER